MVACDDKYGNSRALEASDVRLGLLSLGPTAPTTNKEAATRSMERAVLIANPLWRRRRRRRLNPFEPGIGSSVFMFSSSVDLDKCVNEAN